MPQCKDCTHFMPMQEKPSIGYCNKPVPECCLVMVPISTPACFDFSPATKPDHANVIRQGDEMFCPDCGRRWARDEEDVPPCM